MGSVRGLSSNGLAKSPTTRGLTSSSGPAVCAYFGTVTL